MDVRIDRALPVYRCVLDGAVAQKQYSTLASDLMPLLVENYAHLILDGRLARSVTPGAVALCFAPLQRILLKGGGVALLGPPDLMRRSLEQLGLQTRIPVVEDEDKAYDAILRMIPKRYSNEFFSVLLQDGIMTSPQIRDLHTEYKRQGGSVPFGNLLIQRGFTTTKQLLSLLDKVEHPDRYQVEGQEEVTVELDSAPVGPGLSPSAPAEPRTPPPKRDLPKYSRGDRSMFAPSVSEFHQPRLLGEILIEAGVITEEQLRNTMEEQRATGEQMKLGDLLVKKGLVNPAQLFEALEIQLSRRGSGQAEAVAEMRSEFVQKSLLGEILLEMDLIKESDLRMALDEQRGRPGAKIGNILLQMGVIDSEALLQALEYQANRRG